MDVVIFNSHASVYHNYEPTAPQISYDCTRQTYTCSPQIHRAFMNSPLSLVDGILKPAPEWRQDSIALHRNTVCILSQASANL